MLSASQIEEAVTATLQKWFPTYLAEIARQLGVSKNLFPHPENYTTRNSFEAEPGEKIPKVVVISPGWMSPPVKTGDGSYRVVWRLGVGVATGAKDEQSANLRVKGYGAAVRAMLAQQADLGGEIYGIREIYPIEETYVNLPITNQHQLYKAASLWFSVDIQDIMNQWAGPDTPIITAPPDYPEVEEVIIEIDQLPDS
jgi:hypothetical protein